MKIFDLPLSDNVNVVTSPDPQHLAKCLKRTVSENLSMALQIQRRASLVLSGGSTPQSFLAQLSESSIPWDRVDVTLADERWVEPEAAESNEGMLRRLFLRNAAAAANFVPLWNDAKDPAMAAFRNNQQLSCLQEPLDVVVLGMGTDGHTASFFPGAEGLDKAMSGDEEHLCEAIFPPGGALPRLTLVKRLLFSANKLFLHIEGAKKLETLEQAYAGNDESAMPIRAFLDHPDLNIYWADIE